MYRRMLRIPTTFGEATGKEALKVVNHLLHELNKRLNQKTGWFIFKGKSHLDKKIEDLKKEKEYIIEKVEMIKNNRTPYGLLGEDYFKNKEL